MEMKGLNKKMERLWRIARRDLERISQETFRLARKGELYIKEISKRGERNLEVMGLALQREKLYYELGKTLVYTSKNKWISSKRIKDLLIKIRDISRKIKKIKK